MGTQQQNYQNREKIHANIHAERALLSGLLIGSTKISDAGKNFHFNIPLRKILYEIKAIDENTPERTLRQLIKYIYDQKDFLKEKFGIIINKDIVFYYPKNNNVYFKNISESDKYSCLTGLELIDQ